MGSDSSKSAASQRQKADDSAESRLSADEVQRLRAAVKSSSSNGVDVVQVRRLLNEALNDEAMSERLCRLAAPSQRTESIAWSNLCATVAQLTKPSCTDTNQCRLLFTLVRSRDDDDLQVTSGDLVKFVSDFIRAYLVTVASDSKDVIAPGQTDTIAVYLLNDLQEQESCDLRAFDRWYCRSPLVARVIRAVVRMAFQIGGREDQGDVPLWPALACCPASSNGFVSILRQPEVLLLNDQLPASLRHQWRFLFSSRQYGQSFSQLIRRIVDRGPTLVIIHNKQDEVFGGFASESWQIQSKFYGTSDSFLFTLRPRMGIFASTGYNDHYMYLNLNQQTMPNGLGMGGQLEYFGLYLSHDYGRGTSAKSCTTFHSPQLSESEFEIETLEVWGVGPEPKPEEGTRSSALDTLDPELKAILEMADKAPISDAIREQDSKDPATWDTVTETRP